MVTCAARMQVDYCSVVEHCPELSENRAGLTLEV